MDLIAVTFLKWEEWNPRKDIKRPSWFAMSNRITEHDDIQTLSDAEFRAFIHMFCLASQQHSAVASINLSKAERVTGLKKAVFKRTIERLCSFGICTSCVHDPSDSVRDPSGNNQNANPTLHNRTRHNKTGQDNGLPLVGLWNDLSAPGMPKVDLARTKPNSPRLVAARERLREEPELSYWSDIITRISVSPFCLGENDRGWVADFDFLVRKETHVKVGEGKYDKKTRGTSAESPEARTARILEELEVSKRERAERLGEA